MMRSDVSKAKDKARKLLLENLDDKQKEDYLKTRKFTVKTDKDEYVLSSSETLRKSDNNKFCAVINDIPIEDQLLAKKLYLEHCPDKFFSVANNLSSVTGRQLPYEINSDIWQYFKDRFTIRFQDEGFDSKDIEFEVRYPDYVAYEITVMYRGFTASYNIVSAHFAYSNYHEVLKEVGEHLLFSLKRTILKNVQMINGKPIVPYILQPYIYINDY